MVEMKSWSQKRNKTGTMSKLLTTTLENALNQINFSSDGIVVLINIREERILIIGDIGTLSA